MPQKCKNGDLVSVNYSSQSRCQFFLGIVEDYLKNDYGNNHYLVRYLGTPRKIGLSENTYYRRNEVYSYKNDICFNCQTYEVTPLRSPFVNPEEKIGYLKSCVTSMYDKFVSSCKSRFSSTGSRCNIEELTWISFAHKRLEDEDWTRRYPIRRNVMRGREYNAYQ